MILANIIENTLNTIRNIQNTSEVIKNRMSKQHNKNPNLILAVVIPHTFARALTVKINIILVCTQQQWALYIFVIRTPS